MEQHGLERNDILKIFFRSFLLDATENYETMKSVGFSFVMMPAIKKLYGKAEEVRECLKGSLGYFNVNPYFAAPLIGVLTRLVESKATDGSVSRDRIETVKRNFMGPLAAIGDAFFWASLRPLAALIGVATVLYHRNSWPHGLWGLVFFLVIYNIPHLAFRYWGLQDGYKHGENMIDSFRAINFQVIIEELRLCGMIFLGAYLPAWFFVVQNKDLMLLAPLPLLKLVCFGVALLCWRSKFTPTQYFCLVVAACILAAYLGLLPPL